MTMTKEQLNSYERFEEFQQAPIKNKLVFSLQSNEE